MKKIALVGFNIFSPGGTSRSNLNLIAEFKEAGYSSVFYNYQSFSKCDVKRLREENPYLVGCPFKTFDDLSHIEECEYVFVTREEFFCLAPFIRQQTNAKIIGEIHAPLSTIRPDDIRPYLSSITCVRVATDGIRKEFIRRFDYSRVYAQRVSLKHVNTQAMLNKDFSNSKINLHVLARFDYVKDIEYSIRLVDYLVNSKKISSVNYYINGYGSGEENYRELVKEYGLEDYVFINKDVPNNHIYLCTSRAETFGYSIVEEISEGDPVILYKGDDGVLKENFSEFRNCLWITKDISRDADAIEAFVKNEIRQESYYFNLKVIEKWKQGYVEKFETNVAKFQLESNEKIKQAVIFSDVKKIVNQKLNIDKLRGLRLIYYRLRQLPVIGRIIRNEKLRRKILRIIKLITHSKFEAAVAVDENQFFIESFHGTNFAGDPKYFALSIKENKPKAKIYVSSINQFVDNEIANNGLLPVRVGSVDYLQKFKASKYVFMNGNSLDKAGKNKNQVFVQTWHGFPLKKMVNDLADSQQRKKESMAFEPRMKKWDFLTTSSVYNTELLTSAFDLKENAALKIISRGTPKNEYLLKNRNDNNERQRVYKKYFNREEIKPTHFVLFCPTWRKDNREQVFSVDLVRVIEHLPKNYELIVKLHPNEGELYKKYAALNERIHCFKNEIVDIQELYILSDVLISDYSSAMFDFSLLERPIIVLQEDEENYVKQIGWYFDIKKVLGMDGVKLTSEELAKTILNTNMDEVNQYTRLIKTKLLSGEHVGATNEALNIIFGE